MNKFLKNKYVITLVFCLLISALVISKIDYRFDNRWIVFGLYQTGIAIGLIYSLSSPASNNKQKNKKNIIDIRFLTIIFLSIIIRFIFLKSYPFIALGDEVRDGGLNGMQIFYDQIKNIFAYGRYDAHGLIIPTYVSFLFPLFHNSVLTYRVLSALIGAADVILIYFILSKIANKTTAFWASLALISLPLHLFYSRTQIVVIFSSLLTTILLYAFYLYTTKKSALASVALGIIIGFSFNFHASIKPLSFTILGIALLNELIKIIKNRKIKHIQNSVLIIIFTLLSFGPRLWFTTPQIFFHTTRLVNTNSINKFELGNLIDKYWHSLLVWSIEPTQSFFSDNSPILSPVIFIIFLFGLWNLLKHYRNIWSYTLVFLIFWIPFTNSTITEGINYDHRLVSLFPIGTIIVGFGMEFLAHKLNRRLIYPIGVILMSLTCINQIYTFYTKGKANHNWANYYSSIDYLSMHSIYTLQKMSLNNNKICIQVSLQNYPYFQLVHVEEQWQYFLPQVVPTIKINNQISDDSIIIDYDCTTISGWNLKKINCSKPYQFDCPLKNNGDLLIYYKL